MMQSRLVLWLLAVCCTAAASQALTTAAHASYGIHSFEFELSEPPPAGASAGAVGGPDTQAGSHPFEMKLSLTFNTTKDSEGKTIPDEATKDMHIQLPPGLLGNPTAVPQCPMASLAQSSVLSNEHSNPCPASTQIGTMALITPSTSNITFPVLPVYNLVPPPGTPAQFGSIFISSIIVGVSVNTGNYGLTVSLSNLLQAAPVTGVTLTLWGIPADPLHDPFRTHCLRQESGTCPSEAPPNPFLTLPTSCEAPIVAVATSDSWETPETFVEREAAAGAVNGVPSRPSGCDRLEFKPNFSLAAETTAADSPTGLTVDLGLPYNGDPEGLSTAALRDAVVTLPAGMSISPAAGDTLHGCSLEQIGLGSNAQASCPDPSKIGNAEIETSLLERPLSGSIYLAEPSSNPFGSMLALYVTAEAGGIHVKLAGELSADPNTGTLSLRMQNVPELPFTGLKLKLFGGPRALVVNSLSCGTSTTTTEFTPYSAPASGPATISSSSFSVDQNCAGGFSPTVVAGSTSTAAGQSTQFTLQVNRPDGQQYLQNITATLPAGLRANLGSVTLCPDAFAEAGTCVSTSQIGTVLIGAGPGLDPYYLTGQVFLTGPYEGAPFGLAMVIPAVAGPFNLGSLVIRGKVMINLQTAALTISTDGFPSIVQGIPLRIKAVYLTVDRPGFMFNPTDCRAQQISTTAASVQGMIATATNHFGIAGCLNLRFAPTLSATTSSRATVTDGTGLHIKLAQPSATPGTQANLAKLTITLPKQLPARLTALQGSCPIATFDANPSHCPPSSIVGMTSIHTPALAGPLAGPVYLIARGRTQFPAPNAILQGDGVRLDLGGSIDIGSRGAASVTFDSVPDIPMSKVEFYFARGPHSLLTAVGNLCAHARLVTVKRAVMARVAGRYIRRTLRVRELVEPTLVMPAVLVGQNGLVVHQVDKVAVNGCTLRAITRGQ